MLLIGFVVLHPANITDPSSNFLSLSLQITLVPDGEDGSQLTTTAEYVLRLSRVVFTTVLTEPRLKEPKSFPSITMQQKVMLAPTGMTLSCGYTWDLALLGMSCPDKQGEGILQIFNMKKRTDTVFSVVYSTMYNHCLSDLELSVCGSIHLFSVHPSSGLWLTVRYTVAVQLRSRSTGADHLSD